MRAERLGQQIKRDLALLLQNEVADPRVKWVTITAVEVSPDLEHAKVFYTLLDGSDPAAAAQGLRRAGGFLRSQLGPKLRLRLLPELHFEFDESVARGVHLSQLIDQAVAEDQSRVRDADDAGADSPTPPG